MRYVINICHVLPKQAFIVYSLQAKEQLCDSPAKIPPYFILTKRYPLLSLKSYIGLFIASLYLNTSNRLFPAVMK